MSARSSGPTATTVGSVHRIGQRAGWKYGIRVQDGLTAPVAWGTPAGIQRPSAPGRNQVEDPTITAATPRRAQTSWWVECRCTGYHSPPASAKSLTTTAA